MQKSLVSVAIPMDVRYRVYRHVAFLGVLLLGITMYFGFSQKVSEKTSQTQVASVKQVDTTVQTVNLNSINGVVPTPQMSWLAPGDSAGVQLSQALRVTISNRKDSYMDYVYDTDLGNTIVDYDRSIEELARAGKYDWVDATVNSENFPLMQKIRSGKVSINLHLLQFDCEETLNSDAVAWMKANSYRPATLAETLSVEYFRKKFEGKYTIVPLGHLPHGSWVPEIGQYLPSKGLYVVVSSGGYEDGPWRRGTNFAAVRIVN